MGEGTVKKKAAPDQSHPIHQVVIADAELVTAYGHGIEPCWQGLLKGHHAFTPLTRFHHDRFLTDLAGTVPELDQPHPGISKSELLLQFLTPFGLRAPDSAEIFFASTIGEIEQLDNPEHRCTTDSMLEKILRAMKKKNGRVVSAACASANTAVIRAGAMIRRGIIESALIVGLDSVSEFLFSGFTTLKAMSRGLARPYDRSRDGLLLGDMAGCVLMMSGEAAEKYHDSSRCRLTGWAMNGDAVHITAPMPGGAMLEEAISAALTQSGTSPEQIGAIIGHGTGTIYNDDMEIAAVNRLFKRSVPLFSVKGGCGHSLAGSGILQLIVAKKMLETGLIPPQTSLQNVHPDAGFLVSSAVRTLEHPAVLSMNSGFGGLNAVILLEDRP